MSLPSLDLPSKTASKPAAMADAGMDFSIDLPSLEALTGNGEAGGNTLDFGTTTAAISPASTQTAAWQEMATKLDLAAAYEEIGDKDGARELLDEVAKGGDAAQKQKAKSMLSKLG
jgi:pilus assembly protein FimV